MAVKGHVAHKKRVTINLQNIIPISKKENYYHAHLNLFS